MTPNKVSQPSTRQVWVAYQVLKRGTQCYFARIGSALSNPDGSLNVTLEALPINGEFHLRRFEEGRSIPLEHQNDKGYKLCADCQHTHHIGATTIRDKECHEWGCECKEFKDG